MARLPFFFVLTLAMAAPLVAQDTSHFAALDIPRTISTGKSVSVFSPPAERHLQPTAVGALFTDSAFAHGFRHGYEKGFHWGDLDLQMGRIVPGVPFPQIRPKRPSEYKKIFGSEKSFHEGYTAGFENGYSDAASGLTFRASERLQAAAAGLDEPLPVSERIFFDDGFSRGFGSAQAPNAPNQRITFAYVEQYCRSSQAKSLSHPSDYCAGFARGYLLGERPSVPAAVAAGALSSVGKHIH